jgi:hypothetical protein
MLRFRIGLRLALERDLLFLRPVLVLGFGKEALEGKLLIFGVAKRKQRRRCDESIVF